MNDAVSLPSTNDPMCHKQIAPLPRASVKDSCSSRFLFFVFTTGGLLEVEGLWRGGGGTGDCGAELAMENDEAEDGALVSVRTGNEAPGDAS